jgi:hypothetical protein
MLSVMSECAIFEVLSGLGIQHSSSDLGDGAFQRRDVVLGRAQRR